MDALEFQVNGRPIVERRASPTTTLLQYLRGPLGLTATKEGCAEGDCGACTVALWDPRAPGGPQPRAVNSCLVLLPMIDGQAVLTAEGIGSSARPHLVQDTLARELGSQCGFCTPGITMALFEAHHRTDLDARWKLDDQLAGNLCRCTGYRPIRAALEQVAGRAPPEARPAETTALRGFDYVSGAQRYARPATWPALFALLAERPDARIVQGGTDLSLEVTKRFAEPPCLVSLESLPELSALEATDTGFVLGAGVRLSDLETFAQHHLPPLARMLRYFGARAVKHRATIGGNLSTASPIGDLAPVFLALGATLELRSAAGARRVAADAFFLDYRRTALQPGEVVARIQVPALPPGALATSYKVSKRQELDISTVSASFTVELEDTRVVAARLAYGGMAATPRRARAAEAELVGRTWETDAVEAAAARLTEDFAPISDHRGSAAYRQLVAGNLLRGFYLETQDTPLPAHGERPTATVDAIGGAR